MDKISYVESPYADLRLHSVTCKVNRYTLGDGYDIFLQDSFHIEVRCTIDASEQFIRGRVYFDTVQLEKFISDTFCKLNEKCSQP